MRERAPWHPPEEPKPEHITDISNEDTAIAGGSAADRQVRPGVVKRRGGSTQEQKDRAEQARKAAMHIEAKSEYAEGGGGELEMLLFSTPRTSDPDYRKQIEAVTHLVPDRERPGKFDPIPRGEFEDVLPVVMRFQNWDPREPGTDFLSDLRLEIADALGLSDEQMKRLGAYSALHTPLDRWLSTDAFLVYNEEGGGQIVVTMDASLRDANDPTKQNRLHHADVYLGAAPKLRDEHGKKLTKNLDAFDEYVVEKAKEVARLIRQRSRKM